MIATSAGRGEVMTEMERLLEGEDPGTTHADDARHWISIYAELLTFKDDAMEREPSREDVQLIEGQQRRYRHRLQFWHDRERLLQGLSSK
jgi:hypothetical protein